MRVRAGLNNVRPLRSCASRTKAGLGKCVPRKHGPLDGVRRHAVPEGLRFVDPWRWAKVRSLEMHTPEILQCMRAPSAARTVAWLDKARTLVRNANP